nr:MAG TPA: hypothetical protein [Caudoviricetes sp.]DAR70480.1 MAG TPA: hypothetical protein [Caudoviricetes sp.]
MLFRSNDTSFFIKLLFSMFSNSFLMFSTELHIIYDIIFNSFLIAVSKFSL